ncbi:hypothetical protein CDAR_610541, partial [Caerostris darwini]
MKGGKKGSLTFRIPLTETASLEELLQTKQNEKNWMGNRK